MKTATFENCLRQVLVYDEQRFKFKVIAYRVFLMESCGQNIMDFKSVLKDLDVDSTVDINEQFVGKSITGLARQLVETDEVILLEESYKIGYLELIQGIKSIKNTLNEMQLQEYLKDLKDYMHSLTYLYKLSYGVKTYNSIIKEQIKTWVNRMETLQLDVSPLAI